MRTEIAEAVNAINAVFRYESSGGYLHCVISDGNVDSVPYPEEIDDLKTCPWTGKRISPQKRLRYRNCVAALHKLNHDGREYACSLACDGDASLWIDEHERLTGEEFSEDDLIL